MNSSVASSLPTLDLLERLGREMPEVFEQAQVVGKWVWLEFNVAPVNAIREKLRQLGCHWNAGWKGWQHGRGARAEIAENKMGIVLEGIARQ